MKYVSIISVALMLISCKANSQPSTYVVAGANFGYYTHFTGALQVGVRTHNIYVYVANIVSVTRDATTPVITTANVGYNVRGFQPFISYGYHTIGREAEQKFDLHVNGFRFGAGISYYFKNIPLSLTAQRQGKINNFSVGTYTTF